MQTHTKGPWKVLENARGNGKICVTTANGAPVHAVLCEIDVKSVATDDATRLANARLIAAAPDLLAALSRIVGDHADLGEIDLSTDERAALDQGREAIRKAEGNA